MITARSALSLILSFALILTMVSCRKKEEKPSAEKKLTVITTLFPLHDFARNIGKERAEVSLLLPPGVEPHSFELKPADILKINNADVFVYTGKFMEPWVADVIKAMSNQNLLVVDSSEGIRLLEEVEGHSGESGKMDPHVWLDLSNAQKMVDTILAAFIRKDPSDKDFYQRNANEYKARLAGLDERYRTSLAHCKTKMFVHGGHYAFNYLARRYGLTYISAFRGSPDAEPSPGDLVQLIRKIRQHELHYVYYEELITPRVAETIAKETGASLLKLNGAHNITKDEMERGVTFLSIMEQNLENLAKGLQCR